MIKTLTKITSNILKEIETEKTLRKTSEVFLLFALGSQFDHLIKQKLDALGIFCLVADPSSITATDVKKLKPKGIILSGGPSSAYEYPPFDVKIFNLKIPVLGICLGFQIWTHYFGIKVTLSDKREFGSHKFNVKSKSKLFSGIPKTSTVLESHGDIIKPNKKLKIIGATENAPVAAAKYKHLFGVQFHPEVTETKYGDKIFKNFVFKICESQNTFPAKTVAKQKIETLKKQIKNKKVLLALSGGSDSSVVAYILKYAVMEDDRHSPRENDGHQHQPRIRGVYIKGIDRPDDEEYVQKFFGKPRTTSLRGRQEWLDLKIVDATKEFLKALKGKKTMRDKRLAMRGVYKKILEKEAKKFKADFIAQGTLYTDVSESGGGYKSGAKKAQIKIHHNVNLRFNVPEITPLIDSVKDTARNIGREIGVPEDLLVRHPFPGPGLIVRIEGEITAEKLCIAKKVDKIYIEELRKWKTSINSPHCDGGAETDKPSLYESLWQAGAVVTSSNTTATKGDDAAEGHVIALWAVWSVNGFTARAAELPYDFLKHVSRRITNEIREVGAVVYRISDKPPTTIEWG